jgi:hypothetical protein
VDLLGVPVLRPGFGRAGAQRVPVRLLGLPGRILPERVLGDGGQLDRVSNTVAGRTRSRLDVPALRTLSGARRRPGKYAAHDLSPAWVW